MPRFLVILAAFNGAAYLREQVASILSQSGVDVRVVISVDSSTDGTETLVESLMAQDRRITALPFFEVFGGAAPNFLRLLREVDLDSFDYLSLADQDDVWQPEKLCRAHAAMSRTGAHGYSSNVTAFWPSGKQVLIRKSQPQRRWDFLFEGPGPGCTFVLNRSLALACQAQIRARPAALSKVGFHDWLIYALARAHGHPWHIDDWPSMLYRQHGHNQIGVNAGIRSWLRRASTISSGWGFQQACVIARLAGLEADPFVATWIDGQRLGLIGLALHCGQCRRRAQDRVLFMLSCLLMTLHLPHRKERA